MCKIKKSHIHATLIGFIFTIAVLVAVYFLNSGSFVEAAPITVNCSGDSVTPTVVVETDLTSNDITFANTGGSGYCEIDAPITAASVIVQAGVVLTHPAEDVDGVNISTTGNMTVENGAIIDANEKGCGGGISGASNGEGPDTANGNICTIGSAGAGFSHNWDGGGAGHGGAGGAAGYPGAGGVVYDTDISPSLLGSGGGGSSSQIGGIGGGLIRLNITGTLILDGTVTANGQNGLAPSGASGGGSGGSIHITAGILSCTDTITGTCDNNAVITAGGGNGGDGNGTQDGGGGGGGMVRLEYSTVTSAVSSSYLTTLTNAIVAAKGLKGAAGQDGVDGTYSAVALAVPATPSMTAPLNASIDQLRLPLLTTGAYSSDFSHINTDWQVATDSGFTDIVWSALNETTYLESIRVSSQNGTFGGTLTGQTQLGSGTYYVRALHSNTIGDSSWSATISFTTEATSQEYVECYGTSASPTAVVESNFTGNVRIIDTGSDGYCAFDTPVSATSVVIDSGTVLTHTDEDVDGVTINTTGNVAVLFGASIDVSGRGCGGGVLGGGGGNGRGPDTANGNICAVTSSGYGTGYQYSGGGGGHGGAGGDGAYAQAIAGIAYDDSTAPALLGSGGGGTNSEAGADGGGLIYLNVAGTLTLDGSLVANGTNAAITGGGGSGGSIRIATGAIDCTDNSSPGTCDNNPTITANGGNGADYGVQDGGGGGGGMVRIEYSTATSAVATSYLTALANTTTSVKGIAQSNGTSGADGTLSKIENSVPNTPSITAPADSSTSQLRLPVLTTSPVVSGFPHVNTDWEVATDVGFTDIVWSALNETVYLESIRVSTQNGTFAGSLAGQTQLGSGTYYVRALHNSSVGDSAWSTVISFTTEATSQEYIECYGTSGSPTAVIESNFTGVVRFIDTGSSGYCILDQAISSASVAIESGVTIVQTAENINGISISTTGNIALLNGAVIDVSAKGCGGGVSGGNGSSPNTANGNICTTTSTGYGTGFQYAGGGGGHGGGGGVAGYAEGIAGTTYGASTLPVLLGAGGGGTNSSTGGAGGGYVMLSASGTLTLDGSILANGGDGGVAAGGGGGGSGGSIHLEASSLDCTDSSVPGTCDNNPVITANGGAGGDGNSLQDGGGGGGGRVAINYVSATSAVTSSYLSALTASTTSVGGTATVNAVAGSNGTFNKTIVTTATAPSVSSPTEDEQVSTYTPTITTTSFNGNGSHSVSDYQIAADTGFIDIVWSSTDNSTNLLTIDSSSNGVFSGSLLGQSQLHDGTYYVRARHANLAGDSAWSAVRKFVTFPMSRGSSPTPGNEVLTQSLPILLSPNGGELYTANDTVEITWNTSGNNISSIDILYDDEDGVIHVISEDEANDNSFSWLIPNDLSGDSVKILIRAYASNRDFLGYDFSDSDFTIGSRETGQQNMDNNTGDNTVDMPTGSNNEDIIGDNAIEPETTDAVEINEDNTDDVENTEEVQNTEVELSTGDLIRSVSGIAVYVLGPSGTRFIFPNESTFFTHFKNFDTLKTISAKRMASFSKARRATVLPGSLVKIVTSPTVYYVTEGSVLHEIPSEAEAIRLFGENWSDLVIDIPEIFFGDYTFDGVLTELP